MTLCFAWREANTICLASDSRLSFGTNRCDSGIKVSRLPFRIVDASEEGMPERVLAAGDIGLVFAGSSAAALMTKEALSELISDLQGTPTFHKVDMDGISDLMFRSFKVITKDIGSAISQNAATSILFAGYCTSTQRLRAFRMEMNTQAQHSLHEVLQETGNFEVLGSGAKQARPLLPLDPTRHDFLRVLKDVILDDDIEDVGGSIQFGEFRGTRFQPYGVANLGDSVRGVRYWRGPLDLNGDDFDQADGLVARFPYLDQI